MTDKQLDRLMRGWRRWLGLCDWAITVKFCDRDDLMHRHQNDGLVYGGTEMEPISRQANILICDWREVKEGVDHVGPTLVHEMLHLLVDPEAKLAGRLPFENLLNLAADDLIRRRAAGERCPIRRQ